MAMVPCLHQGNIYTKRKLRVWRDQKSIPLVGAITALNCTGRQNTPSRCSIGPSTESLHKLKVTDFLSPWYRVCTKEIFISKRKLRVWRDQKYIQLVGAITTLTCAGPSKYPVSREAV